MNPTTNNGEIKERLVTISVSSPNYEGNENHTFKTRTEKFCHLAEVVKANNYSLITWGNGKRKKENFDYASGFVIDIDKNYTIDEALKIIEKNEISCLLITTKSHTEDKNRFRIIVPTNRTITVLTEYETKLKAFSKKYFKGCDTSVTEGGRFFFHSPEDAEVYPKYFTTLWDADFNIEINEQTGRKEVPNVWDDTLKVKLADGKVVSVNDIKEKEPIYCPFHDDGSPSAFIGFSDKSETPFIHCSTCNKTFWKAEKKETKYERKCKDKYSYSDTVYEAVLSKNRLKLCKLGRDKFYILGNAYTDEQKEELFAYLVNNRHITSIDTNEVSDPTADASSYLYSKEEGSFVVSIPPVAETVQGNVFIEDYLETVFGQYKKFIKEWLAVYCYSNYKKLPFLVLTGERGVGKNTFADFVKGIYEPISGYCKDLTARFNTFVENKLIIIDEADDGGHLQYTQLKKLSGQKELVVERKYLAESNMKNNLNIIILSNSQRPINVDSYEKPTDAKNNQFFVFQMKKKPDVFKQDFSEELLKHFGHYMRTVLLPLYQSLVIENYRYSIEVPITEEEKNLFNISLNEIEVEAENKIRELLDKLDDPNFKYWDFIKNDYVPSEWFFESDKKAGAKIIRELQKRNYLEPTETERISFSQKRKRCYKLGARWHETLKSEMESSVVSDGQMFH